MKKLVTPRVISTVIMLFFLTILGDFFGLTGGSFVASGLLGLDFREYWTYAWQTLVYSDITMGLVKPIVFGFIVATIGCYYGMSAKGGTQGVGRATTEAVVAAMISIIIMDVFVSRLLIVFLGLQ
jgi:phospholipid/cholesterol/gamma-HCH transport system permease protein